MALKLQEHSPCQSKATRAHQRFKMRQRVLTFVAVAAMLALHNCSETRTAIYTGSFDLGGSTLYSGTGGLLSSFAFEHRIDDMGPNTDWYYKGSVSGLGNGNFSYQMEAFTSDINDPTPPGQNIAFRNRYQDTFAPVWIGPGSCPCTIR